MHSISDERNWLTWLVKVRILILMVLLAIELAVIRLTPSPLPVLPFLTGMVLWFVLSLFFLFLVSVWSEHRLQAILQVLSDLAMVTLVVHLTGGIDSSLNFLYPLVIVVACMLLPRVWGYLSAALAFILFGTILELDYYLVIPSYTNSHPKLKALQVVIFVNLFAYFAIAYLAGLLMSKLRQVDVQLKDASGALENLQALHENIVQSMSGGVITTGLDGRITLVNRAAQQLLEISEAELRGRSVGDLFQDPLPHFGTARAHAEVRYMTVNRFHKTFRVMVSALNVSERGDLGFVYSFDDLTEIRRLEREVRMQDRLAAVGRLAAAIAHEIRTAPFADCDPRVRSPQQHHHRFSGVLAGQAISLRARESDPVVAGHSHFARTPPHCRERGHQTRTQLSEVRSLGAGRRRQAQTGVLELLRKRGARDEEKRRTPDRGAGRARPGLGDELCRHRSRHQPAADGKNLRALPVEL